MPIQVISPDVKEQQAVERFLMSISSRYMCNAMRCQLRLLMREYASLKFREPLLRRTEDLAWIPEWLCRCPLSEKTAAARLDALRRFMRFQYENGYIDTNIYELLRRPYARCDPAIALPRTGFPIQRELDLWVGGLKAVSLPARKLHRSQALKFMIFSAAHDGPWLSRQIIGDWVKALEARVRFASVWSHIHSLSLFLCHLKQRGVIERDPLAELMASYPAHGLAGIIKALRTEFPDEALAALRANPDFQSYLAPAFRGYLDLKRATGRIYEYEQAMLQSLDRFLHASGRQLDPVIFDGWLQTIDHLHSTTQSHYYNQARQFCVYLQRSNPDTFLPAPRNHSVPHPLRLPTILSEEEIGRLFESAALAPQCPRAPLRHRAFQLMLTLLYCCGLRLGEVLRLDIGHVDMPLGVLTIQNTKFFKTRYVPMDTSVTVQISEYLDTCSNAGSPRAPDTPLFVSSRKRRYFKTSARKGLYEMMEAAGIRSGRRLVRVHDLRHTFAVHRMVRWYRNGEDVQAKLPILSQYMGHVDIAYTQKYLQLVPELCGAAMERFHEYASTIRSPDHEDR